MKKDWLKFGISGTAAGMINGLFGAGGGMILVPLLINLGKLEDKKAFSTAICIIFPLCITSIFIHGTQGTLDIAEAWPYLLGGLFGGLIGGFVFKKVSANMLHKIFGILILWGGVRLLR